MIKGDWTWARGPKHGATTANVRRYIDFAAANGLVAGDVIVASSVGEFADLASWRANFQRKPQQLVVRILRGNAQYDALMR